MPRWYLVSISYVPHIIQAQVYYINSNTYIITSLFKFTIEKVLKTGLVFLIQCRQNITVLRYATRRRAE